MRRASFSELARHPSLPALHTRPEGLEPPSSSLEDSCLVLLDHGRRKAWTLPEDTMPSKPRDDRGRTCDLPHPKRTLYLAELRPASRPAKHFDGSPTMTICTTYFTLRHLPGNPLPCPSALNRRADVKLFFAPHVIELQYTCVGLSAVHAGMQGKVFLDEFAVTYLIASLVHAAAMVVNLHVPAIVGLAVFALTGTAVAITIRAAHGNCITR